MNPYPDEVRFLLQETDACQDPPLVLAMVVTAVTNRHRRRFIRHTWGHPALTQVTGVKPLFIMGQAKDPKLQVSVVKSACIVSRGSHVLFIFCYKENGVCKEFKIQTVSVSKFRKVKKGFFLHKDHGVMDNCITLM